MFYFLASKFITFGNDSFRNIFIIGSICYIILHAYLFGNNASETVQNYRGYLYYLFLIDAALEGTYMWLFGSNKAEMVEDDKKNYPNYLYHHNYHNCQIIFVKNYK